MRIRRVKLSGAAFYHCISRTVAGEHLFGASEKSMLRRMIWEVAEFCGVEIVTYCVMSNHFHVLCRVNPHWSRKLDRNALLWRYERFYTGTVSQHYLTPENLRRIFETGGSEAEQWERRLRARMGDISEFMKTLKQRFAIWYNRTHQRFGTLWAERFKSLLVENASPTLETVAAYIDLNPLRAGLVADPAEYRWCGYAEAMGGGDGARAGVSLAMGNERQAWSVSLSAYRMVLFGKGSVSTTKNAAVIESERANKVLRVGGRISRIDLLRCRLRMMSEGVVLGCSVFVAEMDQMIRDSSRAQGTARPKERRRLRTLALQVDVSDSVELCCWRRTPF